jgi:hypothetical protein
MFIDVLLSCFFFFTLHLHVSYCEKYYNAEKEESREIYLSLLGVYLKPKDKSLQQLKPALDLLNKHYQRIDIPRVRLFVCLCYLFDCFSLFIYLFIYLLFVCLF